MDNNLTVLVVEDEPLLLEAIGNKLAKKGISATLCAEGRQGLDVLAKSKELPKAIWLDYYLKDMNGLAFVEAVKQNPKWASIPIIVVSNSASSPKVSSMIALGVNKYLLKAQYRLEDIINIINEITNGNNSENTSNGQ